MKQIKETQGLMELILSSSNPISEVQSLSHTQLIHMVTEIGIEESGWLMACATKTQVNTIVDDLLWQYTNSNQFESFSYDQFYELLESLYESDRLAFTQNLAKFDEDLLVDILSHELLIFNLEDFILDMNSLENSMSKELLEKALSSHYQLELDQYLILSQDVSHWDIISTVISYLSEEDHLFLNRLLDRISYITSEYITESDGLYEVLSAREQIIEDNYGERESRRLERGYVTGPMAKSFFTQLQNTSLSDIIAEKNLGIIEKQYLKAKDPSQEKRQKTHTKDLAHLSESSHQELLFLLNLSLEYEKMQQGDRSKQEIIQEVASFIKEGQTYLGNQTQIIKAFKLGQKLHQKRELT